MSNTPTAGQPENVRAGVFISHITEEAAVALKLKEAIGQDFLNLIDVFVSSDGMSIAAGEDWLKSVDKALHNAAIMITLCSRASISRPWIHFETGAAWMSEIPIIPVCHAGLKLNDLRMPLSTRQSILLGSAEGLRQLYRRLAENRGCACPERDFENLATELSRMEVEAPSSQLNNDREIQKQLLGALAHPGSRWRRLERVAIEAGVSEEVAAELLRASDETCFGPGHTTVGLISRVGQKK